MSEYTSALNSLAPISDWVWTVWSLAGIAIFCLLYRYLSERNGKEK